jgi:hypothetical protein
MSECTRKGKQLEVKLDVEYIAGAGVSIGLLGVSPIKGDADPLIRGSTENSCGLFEGLPWVPKGVSRAQRNLTFSLIG